MKEESWNTRKTRCVERPASFSHGARKTQQQRDLSALSFRGSSVSGCPGFQQSVERRSGFKPALYPSQWQSSPRYRRQSVNKIKKAIAALTALLLLIAIIFGLLVAFSQGEADIKIEYLDVRDIEQPFVFSYNRDMQLPELPTGCEATAASTLMRMNGINVSKTELADALPKSDTDFVYSFLGDPYSYSGWACSAPCITKTVNGFLEFGEEYAAVELTGDALSELQTPCIVWVTIDLVEPMQPVRTVDGYGLYRNSHCMVLRSVGENEVKVYDPLSGITEYNRERFEHVYDGMGKQAVYITDIKEASQIIQERSI